MAKHTAFSDLAVMTQEEVAKRLGLTRARVTQLEKRALQKMAAEAERLGLRSLLTEEDGTATGQEVLRSLSKGF